MSKRFAAAACIPELLRQVSFEYGENLAPLQSLAAWLARHGQHVRTLALWDATADDLAANAVNASVASAVTTCLTAAFAPGRLEVLEADMKLLAHTDWLAPARSLRDLTLTGRPLHVSPAIAGLTALQSLELRGRLQYAAGFQFPTSLTRLSLAQDDLHEMPPQVSAERPCFCRPPTTILLIFLVSLLFLLATLPRASCPALPHPTVASPS